VQRQSSIRVTAAAVVTAALIAAAPTTASQPFTAGSAGLDDPFFPLAGNGGYDVRHYSLDLDYQRAANQLDARAIIVAKAEQNLSSFNLDLRGFTITDVEVNGRDATFARSGEHELTVTPRRGLRSGLPFFVKVEYEGMPALIIDPDGTSEGWVPTSDGAFVVNEPQGSPGWYPANDNPRDKATYDFAITVPEGNTAIGNGRLLSKRTRDGRTTWRWLEDSPMAPYLATATNGVFDLTVNRWRGRPLYQAVDPALPNAATHAATLAREAEVLEFFDDLYGRYPFSTGGGVVDDGRVGYALESQTKSMYDRSVSFSTLVHEVAHQWYGNAVTLTLWPDIWLNEGFATWSEWIWFEEHGGPTAAEQFDIEYARPDTSSFWQRPPADLGGPQFMFTSPPYDRGAMTLQALREKIGDADFMAIMRAWYRNNRYGNVTTADLIRLSERISGQQLDEFFNVWLFLPAKPTTW
jgi:aminopeptidase N